MTHLKKSLTPLLPRTADRSPRLFVAAVWLVMLAVALFALATQTRDVPMTEDWLLVPALTGNEPDIAGWLWTQNNEHRIPLPRLILLALLKITNGDFRAGMLFNTLSLGVLALLMMRLARSLRGGQTRYADAFFPVVLLHLGNWENLFWSWQLSFVISVVLACLILLVLVADRLTDWRGAAVAGAALMLLPLCGGTGLLFVPPLALWFLYLGLFPQHAKRHALVTGPAPVPSASPTLARRVLVITSTITLGLMVVYFVGYERPSWTPPNPGIWPSFIATLQFLALAFGPAARSAWVWSIAAALLVILSSAVLVLLAILRSSALERRRSVGMMVFLVSLGLYAAAMGWGRAAVIAIYGFWPIRYVLLAAPVLLLAFFVWELYGPPALRATVQTSLLLAMVLLIPANTAGGHWWRDWYLGGFAALQRDIETGMSRSLLAERHREYLFHSWSEAQLVDHMRMLHEANMGIFAGVTETATGAAAEMANAPGLVTYEIRYQNPQAKTVHFVWGIDGWYPLPKEMRPPDTVVRDRVMHTPMLSASDDFTARIDVPAGSVLDFGFLTTELQDGSPVKIWDGNAQNYQRTALQDDVIMVRTAFDEDQLRTAEQGPESPWLVSPWSSMAIALIMLFAVVYYRYERRRIESDGARRRDFPA